MVHGSKHARRAHRQGSARTERAGDFQLSLGLIVTVVFAVVLLSLAVLWIQGSFGDLTSITHDTLTEGRNRVQDTFRSTNDNFAIWPNQWAIKPGERLRMVATIRNNAKDGQSHQYVINVIPIRTSTCAQGDTACLDTVRSWLTFDDVPSSVLIGETAERIITVAVPRDVVQGSYLFHVTLCSDQSGGAPDSATCTSTALNLASSPKSLTLTISA